MRAKVPPIVERIHRCTEDNSLWESEADAEWPPSESLLEYREVLGLFEAGECERAISQLRDLAGRPLELAPDSAVEDMFTMALYTGGRCHPTEMLLHRIHQQVCNYASDLERRREPGAALRALAVLLDLSKQLASAEPADVTHIFMAQAIRKAAWKSIGTLCDHIGDMDGGKTARRCQDAVKEFTELHLLPFSKRQNESFERHLRWRFYWINRRKTEDLMRPRLQETRQVARKWIETADNAECRAFLQRIGGGE